MKKYVFGLMMFMAISACGPSAAEIAERERLAQEELLRQQEHIKEQEKLRNLLIDLKSQLAGEQTKLESIEGFHLLRSPDEKAQQVADQTKVIEEIRSKISEVQKHIDN